MRNYLIRVQLPDRPGALGAVASRIGSVGGDVVSIEILQRDNGAVVDELGVRLPGDHLLGLLRDEVLEVDGVTVEAVRPVRGPLPDPHAELLEVARDLLSATTTAERLDQLARRVQRVLAADFAAVVEEGGAAVLVRHGRVPADGELVSLALDAAVPLTPPPGAHETEPSPDDRWRSVTAAGLVRTGVVLVVGRAVPVLRARERQWVAVMAELVDHGGAVAD